MKYDKEHIDRILNSLKEGSGRYAAAKAGNISFETFCEWMRTKTEFSDNVKKAEFEGQAYEKYTLEKNIKNASDKYGNPVWQSSAWLLERKYPKEYGQRQALDLNTQETVRNQIAAMFPTQEEMDEQTK